MSTTIPRKLDYAILGGGGAGLSMLCHLHWQGALEGKEVAIIDPEIKTKHDRTWSFWERENGPFESVVRHQWSSIGVHSNSHSAAYDVDPLRYKIIISSDFYRFCNELIDELPNVHRILTTASAVHTTSNGLVSFNADGQEYLTDWAFSSLPKPLDYRTIKQPYLDQHFRGWFIRTQNDCFDVNHATLMDFRTPQNGEARFFYVLPISPNEALVEIAIFSNDHLSRAQYDHLIGEYLASHWSNTGRYEVFHTEQGVIPMTTYPYPHVEGRIVNLGLGGGFARPSTGYTFYNIQKRCSYIAKSIKSSGSIPNQHAWPSRHLLYDGTLLNILAKNTIPGDVLFPELFGKNPTSRVLDFLNGETSLLDEVKLMNTTNIPVFGRSFVKQLIA